MDEIIIKTIDGKEVKKFKGSYIIVKGTDYVKVNHYNDGDVMSIPVCNVAYVYYDTIVVKEG